jgi:hypothetical protein
MWDDVEISGSLTIGNWTLYNGLRPGGNPNDPAAVDTFSIRHKNGKGIGITPLDGNIYMFNKNGWAI